MKPNLFKVSANEANVKEKSKECAFISAFVSEAYTNNPKSLCHKCQNILSLILNHINSSNQPICCYKYPNTQRRRCSASIPMDVPRIANVITMQRCKRHANIPKNVFGNKNALMVQRRRCCAFDSPGLARNEPTPGKRSQGDSTPSVLSFFYEGIVIMKHLMAG